jgi:hypothetical protein
MLRELGIEDMVSLCLQPGKRTFLVSSHETAVAHHVCGEDGGKPSLDAILDHYATPSSFGSWSPHGAEDHRRRELSPVCAGHGPRELRLFIAGRSIGADNVPIGPVSIPSRRIGLDRQSLEGAATLDLGIVTICGEFGNSCRIMFRETLAARIVRLA